MIRPTGSGRRDRVAFAVALEKYEKAIPASRRLSLGGPGSAALGAWFLGPKAENEELMLKHVTHAIRVHSKERRTVHPKDPAWITRDIKSTKVYKDGVKSLDENFRSLVDQLRGSVPFYSYRYQAHMLWDNTLPSVLGYVAALLYNQNNVAAEASPVTTLLEMAVGDDLCKMLGYHVPRKPSPHRISPWGHLTCDGSMANIESMWSARNLKFYAIGLASAIAAEPCLAAGRGLTVRLLDGRKRRLLDLDQWTLLNLRADDVLALPGRLASEYKINPDAVDAAMQNYTVQGMGMVGFRHRFLDENTPEPRVFGPATMHYSWPKAAALLGVGEINLWRVHVDLDGRMQSALLEAQLQEAVATKRPVIMAVAVIGSTEESSVDPLHEVIALRAKYRKRGLNFHIHADAAWGGYFASLLRRPARSAAATVSSRSARRFVSSMVLSRYVTRQLKALAHTDSITVDPHKSGCAPYPAGSLCYRNLGMRSLVSLKAPVVFHSGVDPTVGVYGVEGSKPGAAAAAVYLSHRVIRPDQSGYGRLLGKCAFNSTRFYAALVTMESKRNDFIVVPFQRLPAERQGLSPKQVEAQLSFIRTHIVPKSNDELLRNRKAMALFRELGADLTICSYSFNFRTEKGLNKDILKLNALNQAIFDLLSLHPGRSAVRKTPLIVTSSTFDPANYGRALVDNFKERLGVGGSPDTPVNFLISTALDPWFTDTADGNFIPTLIDALRRAVEKSIRKVVQSGGTGAPARHH